MRARRIDPSGFLRLLTLAAALVLPGGPARAQTVGDLETDAAIVHLRKDCTGVPNCVEDDLDALDGWITGTRKPSAASRLIVQVGPGDFAGSLRCVGDGVTPAGFVTVRGSGRDQTRITATPRPAAFFPSTIGIGGLLCVEMGFEDFTLVSGNIGVYWIGGGKTSWTDMDIEAPTGWYEVCGSGVPTDPPLGRHRFFGVRITSSKTGYFAHCDRSWFYNSDIHAEPTASTTSAVAVHVANRGDVRVFGGTVRGTTAHLTSGALTQLTGVLVGGSDPVFGVGSLHGEFHMHGGIISIQAPNLPGVNVTGIHVDAGPSASGDASARTMDTGFAIVPGSGGSATRVTGTGVAQAPYLWPSGGDPPAANLQSLAGQDLYVETGCDAGGCASGTDPHLMAYAPGCPNSPWYDLVRGQCRD